MENLGLIALWLYGAASQLFAAYFVFEWYKTHSFLNTITIGAIVSEFKGLLFPFFL